MIMAGQTGHKQKGMEMVKFQVMIGNDGVPWVYDEYNTFIEAHKVAKFLRRQGNSVWLKRVTVR
jgi:hypothetical protein